MKKLFGLLLFLFIFLGVFVMPVSAHFLATDKNIGAILHVDPNDEPVAGDQASFFFAFKDKENKFIPGKCACTFEITENKKIIYSQPLFQNNPKPDLENASVFYTFPQRDVYEVKVIGRPVSVGDFQPFMLTWNFRVDQEANGQAVPVTKTDFFSEHLLHFVGIGILLMLFIVYLQFGKREKSKLKGGGKKHDKEDHNHTY